LLKNTYILCGTDDGNIYVWLIKSKDPSLVHKCYEVSVQALFSFDNFLITCSSNSMTKWRFNLDGDGVILNDFKKDMEVNYQTESPIQSLYLVDSNMIIGLFFNVKDIVLCWNLMTNSINNDYKPKIKHANMDKCMKKLNSGKYMKIYIEQNFGTGILFI